MQDTSPQKLGSASDVENVNPYTGQYMNWLTGAMQGNQQALAGFTPENFLNRALGQTPQIQGLVQGISGDYASRAMDAAKQQSMNIVRQGTGQLTGRNAMFSPAAWGQVQQRANVPFAQAGTQIAGMGARLGGQTLGMMGDIYGRGQAQAGAMQRQLAGQYGQAAAPEYWQPSYYVPGQGGGAGQAIGGGLSGAAAGAAMGSAFPGLGTAAGAALGGLSGLFSGLF